MKKVYTYMRFYPWCHIHCVLQQMWMCLAAHMHGYGTKRVMTKNSRFTVFQPYWRHLESNGDETWEFDSFDQFRNQDMRYCFTLRWCVKLRITKLGWIKTSIDIVLSNFELLHNFRVAVCSRGRLHLYIWNTALRINYMGSADRVVWYATVTGKKSFILWILNFFYKFSTMYAPAPHPWNALYGGYK